MTNLFEDTPDPETSERDELLNKWKDKSKEEILDAKVNADLFIKTLTKRQDETAKDYLEARKQLEAQASLQQLIDKLNEKQTPSSSDTPQAKEEREPKFDPKDIADIVRREIEENKISERRTANAKEVQTKLRERFGQNTASVLEEQANALGLSKERVNELAQESPTAFFRLMGLDQVQTESFQAPPRNNQRNDSFSPKVVRRDYAYYQELKKTNPKAWLEPKIAIQMHNDAIEMGESKFYGSN